MPLKRIEINCDMGEGFGRWKMGPDKDLMDYIDVANIACGFHAGDPSIMLKTVRMAREKGIKTGAHPGLQDLFGFGRRKIEVDPEGSRAVRKVKLKLIRKDMYASILYQVGALKGILDTEGVPLSHIKPHGELFFYMHRDPAIMKAVLRACKPFGVPVYGIENELQTRLCSEMGIEFVHEFYPDIDYDGSGKLVPVYKSKVATVADIHSRILDCGLKDERMSNEGEIIKVGFGHRKFSVCLHSDMPTALENAKAGRRAVDELNSKLGYS